MAKTLLTPAILAGYTPHSDNSMTLRIRTQELTDEQKMDVISHYQKFGWAAFVDSEDATDLEIPADSPVQEGKSPSQRLRSVMFVYWKQEGSKEPFNQYWERWVEKQIDVVKDKLDEV